MQTIRDATILTILILILASVRIGPASQPEPQAELTQVRTAGIGFTPPAPRQAAPQETRLALQPNLPAQPSVNTLPEARFAPAAFAATAPAFRTEIEEIRTVQRSSDDVELVIVQVAEWIEEIGGAAIEGLGDHARETMERVECPKARFKVSTRF